MHRLNISFVEIRVMSAEGPQHQVSIDEIFDSFQEIDVDASGKVSKRELERYLAGGDIQHTFVVVFKTADIGITWVDGANGSVVIGTIEPGSPAFDDDDVVVGLALASVNGALLPPGGAHTLRKAWRALLPEAHITLEFYEPFIIAHDFAYTFDLEIDTSRKKHAHKKSPASGPEATLHGRWSSLWSKLNAWINLSSPRFGQISESSSQKRQLIVVTAKLNMRAYAFASDVVDALGDALFVAAPQHFKLESAVSANSNYTRLVGLKPCVNL